MRTLDMNTNEIVEIVEVKLDQFGFDMYGQFFGEGPRLWNALGSTIDLYIRANTYETAKQKVVSMFPDAIIYTGA
jgi:hypothetical protein